MSFAFAPGDDRDWRVSADRLWRIDRGLVLHECVIATDRAAPADCTPVTRPPEQLDPVSLIAAESLPGGDWLVLSGGTVLRIDAEWRLAGRTLIPEASRDARFVREGQAVFLWTGQGGDLWIFPDKGDPKRVLGAVADLRKLSDGLVATTPDGLFLLSDTGATKRPDAGGLPLYAATVDTRGAFLGLGPDGLIRRQGLSDVPISGVTLPEGVLAVAEGPSPEGAALAEPGALWAQHADGQVRVHWIGFCSPPEPPVATGTNEQVIPAEPAIGFAAEPVVPEGPEAELPDTPTNEENTNGSGQDALEVTTEDGAMTAAEEVETVAENAVSGAAEPQPDHATPEPDPEAEPVPVPEPVPCPQVLDTGLSLVGHERLLQVREDGGRANAVTTVATHLMTTGMLHEVRQSDWMPAVSDNSRALADIRGRIALVDGRPYLAPPKLNGGGGLFAVDRGTGGTQSQSGGRPGPIAAFDLGWLAWDRNSQSVRFGENTGMPPTEAIRNGRFLPDNLGRAAYLGGNDFALLNPYGFWRARIGAEIRPIRIGPFELPLDLSGGRFLFMSDGIDAQTGLSVLDTGRETVTLGALSVTETLRGGALEASYSMDGRDVLLPGGRGFLFDRRGGITAESGRALVLTPLGLVPVGDLGAAIALPPDTTAVDAEGSAALARGPIGWSRYTSLGWTHSDPPWNDRVLAEGGGRRWERKSGTVRIEPISPADTYAVARNGLDFGTDQLLALAADKSGIVAVTASGTQVAARLPELATHSPPVAPDPGARVLDALTDAGGKSVIWAETAQGPKVWDHNARIWRVARQGENLWDQRMAVESDSIRIAFRQRRAEPSVLVEDLDGNKRYAGFVWAAGQDMPFDRVRGFTVAGERILLGTEMGLRRLDWTGQGAAAQGLYSGVAPGARPLAFDRVGRPAGNQARLLAIAGETCLEMSSPDAAPQPCAMPGDLSERALSSSPLWEWRKTDTDILGTYLDHSGQPLGRAILSANRYWPHDRLRRVAGCSGTVVELWADADIVAHAVAGLPEKLQTLPGISELLCQRASADLGQGARLSPGLLAAGAGTAWRLSGQSWLPVSQSAEILARVDGGIPWEASRLRLRFEDPGAVLEVRGLDDVWRKIPWDADRPAIDHVTGIAGTGPTLRLLTPAGVLDWSLAGHKLDPDGFLLRTPDDRGGLANCHPARIEARDGSVQAVSRAPGNPIDILCQDGRIWRGNPAASADAGVFAAALSDIGGDRVFVQTDDWVWTRKVQPGGAEALSIAFREETVSLDGGRLSVDDYAGLAAPFVDRVEIVTQAAGWWRSPRQDLSLSAARRPPPGAGAETATELHSDAVDGEPRLCVQGQDAVIVDAAGGVARSPGCRDVRGADATYTWYWGSDGVAADGIALNGLPLRRNLSGGRFGDLFVIGAPFVDLQGRVIAPTRAGMIVIGPKGPAGTYAQSDPGFLAPDTAGQPVALGTTGAMKLSGSDRPACGALADLAGHLPVGARVLRMRSVSRDAAEVLVSAVQIARFPLLVPCGEVQDAVIWALPIDVVERARYRALGADALASRLLVSVATARLAVADPAGRGLSLDAAIEGQPVAHVAAPDARAVILATDRALYRMDTDQALSRIGAGRAAEVVPPPQGPFAPAAEPVTLGTPTLRHEASPPPPPAPTLAAPAAALPDPAPLATPSVPATPSVSAPATPPVRDNTVPLELDPAGWKVVQQALKDLGLYTGAIDGIAGPLTHAALMA